MKKLKIAVQKSGRLNEESLALLKDCGIYIDNGRDQLKTSASNFPLEIYYLRNGDIPQYLKDGVIDCAIIGENLLVEKGPQIPILDRLGFSKCRVSLAVPKTFKYNSLKDFNGKKIATSYPETILNYLNEHEVTAELHIISGSVEIAPNIGLADAICDIVSSGSTLFKNNLKEVEVILKSEAVLAVSPNISVDANKILDKIRFRIQSVLQGRDSRYVLLNAPNVKVNEIIKILPGVKSPTLLPLAKEGWSSIHSVVNRDTFWDVIEELKAAGAEGILVCPIEKMIQ
ncbi:ATP phosphoribosyltransferase [Aequorivita sediminis]|uniref:ATP phosphoribosyltransferase n=1 Tax=Aequorivita sediminis TaxID=3073653 RepID=UPI0028ABA3EA|nr:ATP phosphoribosyltransferase [Aequorivita sp. F6058]